MMMRTWTIYLGGLLLVGCAARPAQIQLGADHPANPNSPETPLPPGSDTLAINNSALPSQPSTADMMSEMDMKSMGGMKHDMGGMRLDMSTMPNMSGMHHDIGSMKHEAPATRPGENAAPSAPRWTPATVPATLPVNPAPKKPGASADHSEHGGHP
jgi:hypothetical protein